MRMLRVVGMTWFLTFPVLVLLSPLLFEPYHRHCYVTAGSITTQTAMLLGMMHMTLGNSEYAKISNLGPVGRSVGRLVGRSVDGCASPSPCPFLADHRA